MPKDAEMEHKCRISGTNPAEAGFSTPILFQTCVGSSTGKQSAESQSSRQQKKIKTSKVEARVLGRSKGWQSELGVKNAGHVKAVDGVDLVIKDGEFVISWCQASGKTTP